MPTPENANSVMFVRPINTAPAALSRATIGATFLAGGAQLVLRVGRRAGARVIDIHEGAPALARGIGDPLESTLHQRAARGAPGREVGSEFGERGPRGGCGHGNASVMSKGIDPSKH